MIRELRPSLIKDIRLFATDQSTYLEGQMEAVAYGRRIAWFLNSEGFSLGAFPALYVLFMPTLEPGVVQMMNGRDYLRHRYVQVGVPADFPNIPDVFEITIRGIVDALLIIRPDLADTIRHADAMVREHRDGLRFLLKRHETKKRVKEISFNIAVSPKPSQLFISHTDKATAVYGEAEPIALRWSMEGFDLASRIRLQEKVKLTEKQHRPAMTGVVKCRG